MIALVAGVVALVVGGVTWARFAAGRAERHSVQSYEHVLDVLGDVSKRGESAAPVHAPTEEELARPHVQPSSGLVRPALKADPLPAPRVRLRPPLSRAGSVGSVEYEAAPVGRRPPAQPEQEAAARPEEAPAPVLSADEAVITFDDLPAPIEVASAKRLKLGPRYGQDNVLRRAATGAAAAVVLAALGVGGWRLAAAKSGAPPSTVASGKSSGHPTTPSTTPPTVPPTTIEPTSSTPQLVAYSVPSSSYTVAFTATGRCWLGVQQEVTGPYLWDETLLPQSSASYSAEGSVLVMIGAPGEVSIAVNGIPVTLPAGRTVPYRVSFVPQSSPST